MGVLQPHGGRGSLHRRQAVGVAAAAKMIRSIEQLPIAGKRVFIRVDFNVPLEKKTGKVKELKGLEAREGNGEKRRVEV